MPIIETTTTHEFLFRNEHHVVLTSLHPNRSKNGGFMTAWHHGVANDIIVPISLVAMTLDPYTLYRWNRASETWSPVARSLPPSKKPKPILVLRQLRACFEESGKTIQELSEQTGMTISSLRRIFFSEDDVILTTDGAEKIADALGYSVVLLRRPDSCTSSYNDYLKYQIGGRGTSGVDQGDKR